MVKNEIIGDTFCPSCVERGRDKTGNHLILFSNGSAYCNRCGYSEPANTFSKPKQTITNQKTEKEIANDIEWVKDNSTLMAMKERAIKLYVCKKYGVLTGLSNINGKDPVCSYFPIFNQSDSLIGYKVKSKKDKKIFIKGSGKDSLFFGQDVIPPKGNKLFITEGQEDCLALYQSIYENIDEKYRNRIAVVSLQNGAHSADKEIVRNFELIRGYKEIILCFDMDSPGTEAVEKVLTVLDRSKVRVAKYELKDANDMVKEGKSKELYFNVLQADLPRPEKVVCGVDLEEMLKPIQMGLETPFPGLNKKLKGMRHGEAAGELTVVCAGTGMGKTTLAREIMYCFNKTHKLTLANIFLEEQLRKTGQSYIAIDHNVPLSDLRLNPGIIPYKDFKKSHEELINNGRNYFFNHWGSINSSELMDHFYYFSKVCHCNFVLLDHLSLVISGKEASSQGERKDIDILMTKLAAFTEESGTSVIAIVHLKRPANGSFNEGSQISLNHLRGSSAIEGLAHNIIAVEGDQSGKVPNQRFIRVLKNRETGDVGLADELEYIPERGRLIPTEIIDPTSGIRG